MKEKVINSEKAIREYQKAKRSAYEKLDEY